MFPKNLPYGLTASLLLAFAADAFAVNYQYYRFSTERTRSGSSRNRTVQLSEFSFFSSTGPVAAVPAVSNPGGNNPDGEGPANLVDGNVNTKWLDFNRSPVVFNFGTPTNVHHYGFTTANDASGRDPVRWLFQGSNDGSNWTTLDDQSQATVDYPDTRFASYEFSLNQVTDAPAMAFTVTAGTVESGTAVNVSPGGSATLTWQVTDADSVTLTNGGSVIPVGASASLVVSPTSTRTYTLDGTNSGGTTTQSITVYVGATVASPRLNEILAKAGDDDVAYLDEDHDLSDWIEIYNPNPFAISLDGYGLTDDETLVALWPFPAGSSVEAEGYQVVFASGKNRGGPGQELHSDFSLSKDGEYLALTGPGNTPVDAFAPVFPAQFDDVSYGLVPGAGLDYFTAPTPGSANDTSPGAPGDPVQFLTAPGTFTSSVQVALAVESASAQIRYTLDGSVPDGASLLYTGPITVSETTQVKARSFETGKAPGDVAAGAFLKITSGLAAQTSDLPVVVIENFNAGDIPSQQTLQASYFTLFEPDGVTGRTSLASAPTVANRTGIKRRGSSTIFDAKGSYRVEFWQDGSEEEKDVNLLGMSNHDEWILYAPYSYDRAMVRNAFLFGVSNAIGDYAPRTRFCEVYLNTNGGSLDTADYQGVYVLMERISRDGDRVDVEKLDPWDNQEPDVSGGYMLSIDRLDPGDQGFRSALNHPSDPPNASPQPYFTYVYPKEQNITPAQSAYIRGYIDDLESALYGPNFKDPASGYAAWLDVDASIDHHLMVAFSKDPDGLRLSTYLYKPRGGKLAFGPIWDFDRGMGPDNDNRAANPVGWQDNNQGETLAFFEYDYWGRLFQDPDFMQKWIDRWQELRRGEFSDLAMTSRVDGMVSELQESQVRNQQRWSNVAPNGGPLSALSGYAGEVDHLKNWLMQRAAWIDTQFVAPPIVEAGGAVTPGQTVSLVPTAGTLYFTLDGSDPRLPGGAVSGAAAAYAGTDPVIGDTTTLIARSYQGGQWSGPVVARYIVSTPASAASLVVSEIMYHPANPSPAEEAAGYTEDGVFEYIELQNVSDETIDLTGVVISNSFDFDFTGAELTVLDPGQVVLVVRNRAAFELRYGSGLPVAGEWGDPASPDGGSSLSNGGERILITAADTSFIRDFVYDDGDGWPVEPDGDGPSLELVNSFGLPDHAQGSNWKASAAPAGTPGTGGDYYGYWASLHFSPEELDDPTVSGPEADADHDGLANAIELAFGTDPRVLSTGAAPQVGMQVFEVGGVTDDYLTITFTRVISAPGYAIRPQFSGNLQSWATSAALVNATDHGDGSETVTYRDVVPSTGARRFARVEVIAAP
ncbi:CotH kinase family protein [Luteolibacter marinus]|uniref:CotH kinase family protein n=1 Tax=Luteolibacter marinus TaxID=2776705 RepID=UPI0018662548|nr:CotH kinase family protein [Luteolibacter marinus]